MSNPTHPEGSPPTRHAVVFAFDRLPVRSLGCYGNQTVPTPAFDQFASQAVVFDQHFATQPGTAALDSPVWNNNKQGASGQQSAIDDSQWPEALRCSGIEFQEFEISIDGRQEKGLEECLESVAASLEQQAAPTLSWVRIVDSDANVTLQQNAAGIDELWGQSICDIANKIDASQGMILVTAAGGEVKQVNDDETEQSDPACEARFHTPLVVRLANGDRGTRRNQLVQTTNIAPTLYDWFGLTLPKTVTDKSLLPWVASYSAAPIHDHAIWQADLTTSAIRSTGFLLTRKLEVGDDKDGCGPEELIRLYIKPDDFFDVHDVANQYPTVVSELLQLLPPPE